ncbi:hypothetical protein [Peptostreptococcus sp. D1]|uniref:hypothetical protein n=1 Tax=Peptostreptococcus sp. D1 TaxID=72304 RepID=UPI0008EEC012|nr:hypothetical protein [Peptostreptococcus sp. D1]SFE83831.1 hypothetical protein SAMN02910278_01831 [Peptostreptococcus sp. D1]
MQNEERLAKVQFSKNGQGYRTTRIALPIPWIDALGISIDDRDIRLLFDRENKKIVIRKK